MIDSDLLLEDGSGRLELEDGSGGILLEPVEIGLFGGSFGEEWRPSEDIPGVLVTLTLATRRRRRRVRVG